MTPPVADPVPVAALLLVNNGPGAWKPLLERHVADQTGHCAGCRSPSSGAPVWPCMLWTIADAARHLARPES
ncbi:MAG: hypothetical protein JO100_12320 [Pseudonocardia sp.]|nr:hypothetical protein [Pseudonocardia sp.]